jgi:thioredoxin-dependent peroxiredoxin
MTLQIGDNAPDFAAQITENPPTLLRLDRRFPGCIVLTPEGLHPRVHTELAHVAELKPEFNRRTRWADDVKETQGFTPNHPMVSDAHLSNRD